MLANFLENSDFWHHLATLPAKDVCIHQSNAAKRLLPCNLSEHLKICCHIVVTQ